jgi:hypothetical protein
MDTLCFGWKEEWHLCGREDNKLIGTCLCTNLTLMVNGTTLSPHGLTNFLCVNRDLRDKNLPPLIVQEMLRRLFIKGSFQMSFTAARIMPTPYGCSRVWVRLLKIRKCVMTDYSKGISLKLIDYYEDMFSLPTQFSSHALREMTRSDIDPVRDILNGFFIMYSKVHRFWS